MAAAATTTPPPPPPPPPAAATTATTHGRVEKAQTPKGNWLARHLRLVNNSSQEVFPRTPADHKPVPNKFHSMYKKDFYEYPTDVVLEGLAPKGKEPPRENIRDVLFGQSPTAAHVPRRQPKHPMPPVKACLLPPNPDNNQGFGAWRIPNRLGGEVEDAKIGDHVGMVEPEHVETPRILRQSTFPVIASPRDKQAFTPKPRLSAADAVGQLQHSAGPIKRAKTTLDPPSAAPPGVAALDLKTNNGGSKFKSRVAQWEEKLPDVDPRLLHKVLRLQDAQQAVDIQQRLRGTLLPDARRTVERWLESASESERLVALQFFRSLAGSRLMGAASPASQHNMDRLRDVVDALQRPGSRWVQEAGLSPRGGIFCTKLRPPALDTTTQPDHEQDKEPGTAATPKILKHFRLLDSNTRRNRWMHTTWHHLPQYHHSPDTVNNSSSQFVQPQQLPHRHFVIHPDWAPKKK